jgi:hypothetical protein
MVEGIGEGKKWNEKYSIYRVHICSDNDALREDFNAAACRSITEIYRSAEMKLKNMMMTNDGGNGASKEGGRK